MVVVTSYSFDSMERLVVETSLKPGGRASSRHRHGGDVSVIDGVTGIESDGGVGGGVFEFEGAVCVVPIGGGDIV